MHAWRAVLGAVLAAWVALGCRASEPVPDAARRSLPRDAVAVERACGPVAPVCPAAAPEPVGLDSVPAWSRIREIAARPAAEIDVAEVSLQIARARDPAVDVDANLRQLDEMAREVRRSLPTACDERCRLRALTRHIFNVWRFRASDDPNGLYNDPDQDLLDQVLAHREGYCEGLSLLYLALGRRLAVPLAGVLARQHMYVRYVGPGGPIDLDATRQGAPPLPAARYPGCHEAEGVYGRALDAREMVGQIVSVVGIIDELPARRAWLDAAVEMAPRDPDLRNNRGVERERWFDLPGALEDYRAASALDPCVGFYRTNIAGVLRQMGRLAEAARVLDALDESIARHAAEDDPVYTSLARGDLLLEEGDDNAALRWYSRAIEVSREAPVTREALGVANLVQGDPTAAAVEFLAALEHGPRAETRLWLVEALLASNNHHNAAVELERAARDGAPPEDVEYHRAAVAVAEGRVDEAADGARRCLERSGVRCTRALVVLGDVAQRRGDVRCAREYWETFLQCPFPPRDRYRRTIEATVLQRITSVSRPDAGVARE